MLERDSSLIKNKPNSVNKPNDSNTMKMRSFCWTAGIEAQVAYSSLIMLADHVIISWQQDIRKFLSGKVPYRCSKYILSINKYKSL